MITKKQKTQKELLTVLTVFVSFQAPFALFWLFWESYGLREQDYYSLIILLTGFLAFTLPILVIYWAASSSIKSLFPRLRIALLLLCSFGLIAFFGIQSSITFIIPYLIGATGLFGLSLYVYWKKTYGKITK